VLAIVSASTLNVRSGPGTEFEIIFTLIEGDYVTITEVANDHWVKAEVSVLKGQDKITFEGYVFKKYLSF
jgi:uncharacterized protein YgiM (DUF1202 family)